MTVKKPAFIYSLIVETLKACRTKERGAGCSLEDKVDTYTAAVIITMCKEAVEERRDIRDFRSVCCQILLPGLFSLWGFGILALVVTCAAKMSFVFALFVACCSLCRCSC